MTYNARIDYTYGGSANFSVPFPYIDKSHIVVLINGTATNGFSFTSSNQITVSAPLVTGDTISIRRATPINEPLVQFTDTSILDEDAQNTSRNQLLYHLQETVDMYSDALTAEEITNITQNCVTYTYINEICNYSTLNTTVESVEQAVEALTNASNIYQDKKTLTNGTVSLEDETSIYISEPTSNITYSFSTSSLTEEDKVITFELVIKQPSTAISVTFPENVSWIGTDSSDEPPAVNIASKTYMLVFRSFDNGSNWVGNLQGAF